MKHTAEAEPGRIMQGFRRALTGAMRAKWLTIGVTLAALACSIFGLRFVPQQFFPASDRPELLVDLKLSEASSIYATEKVVATFEELLKGDPDIDHWTTYVGQGAVRFYLPLDVQLANNFFAQSVIVTKSLEARERLRSRIEPVLIEKFPGVVSRLSALELGPPVGWPLQYRVSGPEPARVREIAYKLSDIIANDPRTEKISFDWIEPQRTLRVRVDQDQARLLGVSSQVLAQSLSAVVSGINVTKLRDGIYLIDVVARADEQERISPDALRTLQIPIPNGGTVPLLQLATVEYSQDWPLIWRRDRDPTLTVQSDLIAGVLPATLVDSLHTKVAALNAELPVGYGIVPGGSVEEGAKSTSSVAAVVPAAFSSC